MAPAGASTECPACLGAGSKFFIKIDRYDIFRCPTCGHGFVHPCPGRGEIEAAYLSGESGAFNSNAFELLDAYVKSPLVVRAHYDKLVSLIEKHSPCRDRAACRVFEAGCSTGVLLKCLKDDGYTNVRGVELNPAAAEAGINTLGLDIDCGSIEEYSTTEKFDLIIACAVLEHAVDPVAMLARLAGLLADGGAVFFVVPNFDGALRMLSGSRWLWYMPPFHLHHFTAGSMRETITRAGLLPSGIETRNTGSNSYLIHHYMFGGAKTEKVNISSPDLFKLSDAFDKVTNVLFSPVAAPLRAAGLGAHITGAARKPHSS